MIKYASQRCMQAKGRTALFMAVRKGDREAAIAKLLEHGASINHPNKVERCCTCGGLDSCLDTVQQQATTLTLSPRAAHLLSFAINFQNGWTPVHVAARRQRHNEMDVFLESGANVDASNDVMQGLSRDAWDKLVSMLKICEFGRLWVWISNYPQLPLNLVLGHHTRVFTYYIHSQLDYTPLHYAVDANDEIMVRKLLDAGADINIKNKVGRLWSRVSGKWSEEYSAIQEHQRGHAESIRPSQEGNTAFQCVATPGQFYMLSRLLVWAAQKGRNDIVEDLKKNEAHFNDTDVV